MLLHFQRKPGGIAHGTHGRARKFYLSFPGSSLGTFSSCGSSRFLKNVAGATKKKKILACMFVGTGTIGGRGASGRCSHAERGNNKGMMPRRGHFFRARSRKKPNNAFITISYLDSWLLTSDSCEFKVFQQLYLSTS